MTDLQPLYIASSKRLRVYARASVVSIEALDLVPMTLAVAAVGPVTFVASLGVPRLAWPIASIVALAAAASCCLRVRIDITAEATTVVRTIAGKLPWSTRRREGLPRATVSGWGDWAEPHELGLHFEGTDFGIVLGWGRDDVVDCLELAERINAAVAAPTLATHPAASTSLAASDRPTSPAPLRSRR
jgi:hypothetical protein